MRLFTTLAMTSALAVALVSGATAQTRTLTAGATATVNANGPRTGASGTNFFNVEGAGNNANATFGVADFSTGGLPATTDLSGLTLTLTESDAAFTAPGTFQVYLAGSAGTATSGLKYDTAQTATGGIGTQLGTLYNLGTFQFTSSGNANTGKVDNYTLSLAGSGARSQFLSELSSGTLRLALGADAGSPATAATFFGSTGKLTSSPNQVVAPTLSFGTPAAVPEASTTVSLGLMLALGLGGLLAARRRKAA